jgi:hypothetical protein
MSRNGYTRVANALVFDKTLNYRALGLLVTMLKRQEVGASLNARDLAAGTGREGRDAVLNTMAALEQAGYLHRVKVFRGDRGLRTIIRVYDTPTTAETAQIEVLSAPGSQAPSHAHSGPGSQGPSSQGPVQSTPLPTEGDLHLLRDEKEKEAQTQRPLWPSVAPWREPVPDAVPAPGGWRDRPAREADVPLRRRGAS